MIVWLVLVYFRGLWDVWGWYNTLFGGVFGWLLYCNRLRLCIVVGIVLVDWCYACLLNEVWWCFVSLVVLFVLLFVFGCGVKWCY